MLNEAANNKDLVNIVLNKASNSSDDMHIVNNVCLTTMGAQQFSVMASYIAIMQKSRLTRDEK